jgi:integrase
MASLRKRGKNWYYAFIDADGRRVERKGCPDKRATEELAREVETSVARSRAGLIDPRAERMADAERRPIGDHLGDFIATLTAKGSDPKHIAQTHTYIDRLLGLGNIGHISDLAPSVVLQALAMLKARDGLSPRTVNAHITAIKALSRWLWRDGRSAGHPLACIGKVNEDADRRRVRRPFAGAELLRLIEATRTAPPWRGMSGTDRAWFYTIGAATGFRRSELASLTPAGFRLTDDLPTIVVQAAYTKNGKMAEQPIPPSLAAALRPWIASKPPGRPVFEGLPEKTGRMLKNDLDRIGIKAVDATGRVVDMHALRHGYITTLAKSGVPVKTLQILARHADPKTTLNVYAHLDVADTALALNALPSFVTPIPEAPASSGADLVVTPTNDRFAAHLPHAGDASGQILAPSGETANEDSEPETCRKPLDTNEKDTARQDLAASGENAPRRTRTDNPLIKSQGRVEGVSGLDLRICGSIMPAAVFQRFQRFPVFSQGFSGFWCRALKLGPSQRFMR